MPCNETNNIWVICLNCENELSLEEAFTEEEDTFECPICDSKSFRRCDEYGSDENSFNYGEWY